MYSGSAVSSECNNLTRALALRLDSLGTVIDWAQSAVVMAIPIVHFTKGNSQITRQLICCWQMLYGATENRLFFINALKNYSYLNGFTEFFYEPNAVTMEMRGLDECMVSRVRGRGW